MRTDNPGTWPDMGNGAYITSASSPVPVGPLFTASDLKAAKLETVERCINIVKFLSPSEEADTAIYMMENIKEEINAS